MRYIPHTDRDIEAMLEAIGVERIEDLFDQIPRQLLEREPLDLPPAMSEPELLRHLRALAAGIEEGVAFLGAGAYPHHIPSAIPALVGRSEFYTAYTPYQPEISQGTLQAIFEFQTMICQLTGMEVANASLYDGASSVAEGCLMAQRVTRRKRILLSQGLHPEYRQVVRTYTGRSGMTIEEIPLTPEGRTDLDALATALHRGDGGDVACVVIQNPNFFGIVETIEPAAQSAHEAGALMIATFTEALSLALLEAPGKGGADIVAGEGQSFGIPLSFGGPYLGLFAAREAFVRKMPGRIVGQTVDHANQRRGFVLTLATREQHIRRERATSNICTNQGLCALTASIYLALLGRSGLRRLAETNLSLATYAKERITALPRFSLPYAAPTFNEFVVRYDGDLGALLGRLHRRKIFPGVPLSRFGGDDRDLLVCVTEVHRKRDIDALVSMLGGEA